MPLAIGLPLLLTRVAPAGALPAGFVKVSGFDFRDRAGKGDVVYLRGVNLGGWLCQEAWMCPSSQHLPAALNDATEDVIQRELLKRFSVSEKNAMVDAFQGAWINGTDLDAIAALGMNLIRVPVTYCTFIEANGAVRPDAQAFKYLDWVVREAGKRGIYTLIDLHRVPGGQNTPKHDKDPDSFWYNQQFKQRADEIWGRIALRYRGEPMVIGYDLINEPWGIPLDEYDRLLKVIRNKDPDHTIFVETWGIEHMPAPSQYRWTNVACSEHFYPSGDAEAQLTAIQHFVDRIIQWRKEAAANGMACALHVGEFRFADETRVYDAGLKAFADLGLAWTFWTYKTTDKGGWGLYNRINDSPQPAVPDIYADPSNDIASKWSAWRTPVSPTMNPFTCGCLAMPVAADHQLMVPSEGVLTIRESDLLAHDHYWLSSDHRLRVSDVPARTLNGTLKRCADGWVYRSNAARPTGDSFTYRCRDEQSQRVGARAGTVTLVVAHGS